MIHVVNSLSLISGFMDIGGGVAWRSKIGEAETIEDRETLGRMVSELQNPVST